MPNAFAAGSAYPNGPAAQIKGKAKEQLCDVVAQYGSWKSQQRPDAMKTATKTGFYVLLAVLSVGRSSAQSAIRSVHKAPTPVVSDSITRYYLTQFLVLQGIDNLSVAG